MSMAALATVVPQISSAQAAGQSGISAERMSEITRVLASDEFEGRSMGGPGEEKTVAYLIEQFRQADSSTTREHGGLGLGLAIASEIVAMHHGTIVADNRPGGGAVFVVRLPNGNGAGRPDGVAS